MEFSPACYPHEQPEWTQWSQLPAGHQYPSQYISRQNSNSSNNPAAVYGQYAGGYPQTCPLPQSQSPYSHQNPVRTRPKSQSWPRTMVFSTQVPAASYTQQSPPALGFYQGWQCPPHTGPYIEQPMSVTPKPQNLQYPASFVTTAYENDVLHSSEVSTESISSIATPPSAQSLSYQSTPIATNASLSTPLPAQPGLLGLNCHFIPSNGQHTPPHKYEQISEPKKAKLALRRVQRTKSLQYDLSTPLLSDTRVFECDFCDMKFDRKSNLKDHNRTHGVGKRFVPCHIPGCTKYYGRKADVNRHVRSFHKKDSVSCDYCNKRFVRVDSLTRHNVDNCRRQQEREQRAKKNKLAKERSIKHEIEDFSIEQIVPVVV